MDVVIGRRVLHDNEYPAPDYSKHRDQSRRLSRNHSLLRYALQKWQTRWTSGPLNPNPAPFHHSSIPTVSGGMMAVSKLFGPGGDHASYFLNEANILAEFRRRVNADNAISKMCRITAFKGSRQNWFLENAVPILLLHEMMVQTLHQLLVCVARPNDLVVAALNFLSDHSAVSCLAARAMVSVELITPNRFLVKGVLREESGGRWKTTALKNMLLQTLRGKFRRGGLKVLALAAWPEQTAKISMWFQQQLPLSLAVHEAIKPFMKEVKVLVESRVPALLAKIEELHDGDFDGDMTMYHAFVSNDFQESGFGVFKDAHRQSNKIRKVMNVAGPTMCRMNGTFSTMAQLFRQEEKSRVGRHDDAMTKQEMLDFMMATPLVGFEALSDQKQEEMYLDYRFVCV